MVHPSLFQMAVSESKAVVKSFLFPITDDDEDGEFQVNISFPDERTFEACRSVQFRCGLHTHVQKLLTATHGKDWDVWGDCIVDETKAVVGKPDLYYISPACVQTEPV